MAARRKQASSRRFSLLSNSSDIEAPQGQGWFMSAKLSLLPTRRCIPALAGRRAFHAHSTHESNLVRGLSVDMSPISFEPHRLQIWSFSRVQVQSALRGPRREAAIGALAHNTPAEGDGGG
eukprot:6196163-Pleurochrysis_carterae.AAC.1